MSNNDRTIYLQLASSDVEHIVNSQVGVADYLQNTSEAAQSQDRHYTANESLWRDVLSGDLRATSVIHLDNVLLFEWFPRSPGLFHTQQAKWAREEAKRFVVPGPAGRDHAPKPIEDQDVTYVYEPHGKFQMLKGGIGCLRLKPRTTAFGETYFMCASFTGIAHEGFPVALPEHTYRNVIELIATRGVCECSLTGRLQFLPNSMVRLFQDYEEVPQLYLFVEELPVFRKHGGEQTQGEVTAAVSFESEYQGSPGMYASYVTFNPSSQLSFKSAVDWLDDVYVRQMYGGKIVTDFDEQVSHYAGAVFSLEKVMSGKLNRAEISSWMDRIGLHGDLDGLLRNLKYVRDLHVQIDARQMVGPRITVGDGSPVSAPIVITGEGSSSGSIGNVAASKEDKNREAHVTQRLNMILAFAFGLVLIGAILTLVVKIPNPTVHQFQVFAVVLALAAGGFSSVLSGMLNVRLNLNRRVAIGATGALAVFVIVYFFVPAMSR